MRISSLFAFTLLAGCGTAPDPVATAAPENRIECAIGAGAALATACAIERGRGVVVLRHADGGFRRLAVAADRTLTVADGADDVVGTALPDGRLEIAVGGDRYRLPAGK